MAVADAAAASIRWLRKKTWSSLPKRRTVVRAFLCSVLVLMPFLSLATLKVPQVLIPFWVGVATVVYYSGILADVTKQLRWMRRMSGQGPIFWFAAFMQRRWVWLLRRLYGDAMDRQPLTPTQIGLIHRTSKSVTVKWHAAARSIYSSEKYQLQMRLADPRLLELLQKKEKGAELADWIDLETKLEATELQAAPLQPDTAYEARVRAVNSAGVSDWVTHAFRTKQAPVEGGGTGPLAAEISGSYSWKQHLKDDTLTLIINIPAETRAKQLTVQVKPTTLLIKLISQTLLEGTFFAQVKSDEVEWELVSADGMKQLVITLVKHEKDQPFWPCLLTGHPEVDVRGLKRDPKELEELLAESKLGEMMGRGMPPVEEMLKMRGLDN